MIDLEKLERKMDEFLDNETPESLMEWLMNKRLGNYTKLVGSGRFVGLQSKRESVFSCTKRAKFKTNNSFHSTNPINRKAA